MADFAVKKIDEMELGGIPGKVYDAPEISELGGLDPALQRGPLVKRGVAGRRRPG